MTSQEIRAVWRNYCDDMISICQQSNGPDNTVRQLRSYLNEWDDGIIRALAATISSVAQEKKRPDDLILLSNFFTTKTLCRKELIDIVIKHAIKIPTTAQLMRAA